MVGASLYALAAFYEVNEQLGSWLSGFGAALLIGGLLAVFLFTSARPIRSLSIKNHALRVLEGLQGIAGLSGLFGDVLSYLRLFALGLASASLAVTFNGLATQVAAALPGVGVLFAIVIIVLGHSINLTLAVVSGFVHGLRLNFIEFFRWSVPEEGPAFRAFDRKASP